MVFALLIIGALVVQWQDKRSMGVTILERKKALSRLVTTFVIFLILVFILIVMHGTGLTDR